MGNHHDRLRDVAMEGYPPTAVKLLEAALREDPEDAWLMLMLANAFTRMEDFARAEEMIQAAQRTGSHLWLVKWTRARLERRRDRSEEALKILYELLAEAPGDYYRHVEIAEVLIADKRHAQARPHLAEALKMRADGPRVHELAGLMAMGEDRLEDAEASLLRALRADPERSLSLALLAWIDYRKGRIVEAREHAWAALRIDPDDGTAQLALRCLVLNVARFRADGAPDELRTELPDERRIPDVTQLVPRIEDLGERVRQAFEAARPKPRVPRGWLERVALAFFPEARDAAYDLACRDARRALELTLEAARERAWVAAAQAAERFRTLMPALETASLLVAECRIRAGDENGAHAVLRAFERTPHATTRTLRQRAHMLIRTANFQGAQQKLEYWLTCQPEAARAMGLMAIVRCSLGSAHEALTWADRALAVDPQDPAAQLVVWFLRPPARPLMSVQSVAFVVPKV